jgi:hypothetical protein
MKTELTRADRDKVWRAVDPAWMHYAWRDHAWRAFPMDPRTNPHVMSVVASLQPDGVLERPSGLVEAT